MGSVSLTPQALGRAAIRETLGRRIRNAAEEADKWERINALVSLRAQKVAWLQPEDFQYAGRQWDLSPRIIHALADAESAGRGFYDDGTPVRYVEPHKFSALTAHAFDVTHPDISYPKFVQYRRGAPPPAGFPKHPALFTPAERVDLWVRMLELNVEGGLGAQSVGRFQQLVGSARSSEGWKMLGFKSAEALYRKLMFSEFDQLEIVKIFIERNGLMRALRGMDWRTIARGYNGGGQVTHYAELMAKAYAKLRRVYA